jgi:hypothetical protein
MDGRETILSLDLVYDFLTDEWWEMTKELQTGMSCVKVVATVYVLFVSRLLAKIAPKSKFDKCVEVSLKRFWFLGQHVF